MAKLPTLTLMQKRFLKYYIQDPTNGAEAARRAGYSPKTAKEQAHALLNNSSLLPHLEKIAKSNEFDYGLEAEDILSKLGSMAEVNIFDFIDITNGRAITIKSLDDIPYEYGQFVKSMKESAEGIAITFYEKTKCLDMLARIKGMYEPTTEQDESKFNITFNYKRHEKHE